MGELKPKLKQINKFLYLLICLSLGFCRKPALKRNLVGEINSPGDLYILLSLCLRKKTVLKLNIADKINPLYNIFLRRSLGFSRQVGLKTKPRQQSSFSERGAETKTHQNIFNLIVRLSYEERVPRRN